MGWYSRTVHPSMYVCIDCKSLLIFSDRCVCIHSIGGGDDDDETTKTQKTLNSLLHTNRSPMRERERERMRSEQQNAKIKCFMTRRTRKATGEIEMRETNSRYNIWLSERTKHNNSGMSFEMIRRRSLLRPMVWWAVVPLWHASLTTMSIHWTRCARVLDYPVGDSPVDAGRN